MKKLIILLSLLFAPYLFSSDIKKFFQVNEESKCSFVLIVIDEEDKHFFADFKIDQLKKCEFPVGPIRNNEISCSDFSTISEDVMFKINELVQQKQAIELPVFCIDGSPDITKPRSCLFELDKSKLSYVFNFDDHPIKEMHGIIMKDSDLHQLYDGDDNNSNDVDDDEIDKETEDVTFKPQAELPPASSKYIVFLKELATTLLLKFFELKESYNSNYDKFKEFLKAHACSK